MDVGALGYFEGPVWVGYLCMDGWRVFYAGPRILPFLSDLFLAGVTLSGKKLGVLGEQLEVWSSCSIQRRGIYIVLLRTLT